MVVSENVFTSKKVIVEKEIGSYLLKNGGRAVTTSIKTYRWDNIEIIESSSIEVTHFYHTDGAHYVTYTHYGSQNGQFFKRDIK